MRSLLPQLIIMLLALGISSMPTFRFADKPCGKDAELICSQTDSEVEFILVSLEEEIPLSSNSNTRPSLLPAPQHAAPLSANTTPYRIIFCKKACSAGQVCAYLPLRL
ncbi:MAG: hypothetical protein GX927_06030 [Lentisphaerae bacterium]|jgi:hypothetical protein|nr:hypothetical protein [Lentisphaerota bacterium]